MAGVAVDRASQFTHSDAACLHQARQLPAEVIHLTRTDLLVKWYGGVACMALFGIHATSSGYAVGAVDCRYSCRYGKQEESAG